ncbi:MAG: HEAT repeat domain-containing protein [Deltaproteobacteria bacterium]|nr:HEAT repeat domain-containing protein [Deltaproteobacteria bacterium]
MNRLMLAVSVARRPGVFSWLTGSLLLLGLLLTGCGACGDAVVVKKVLIDVDPTGVDVELDREHLRAIVDDVLDDVGTVRVEPVGDRVLRVRVERYSRGDAAPLPAGHPTVPATATLALSLEISEAGRTQLRGAALATQDDAGGLRMLVEQALRDALGQIEQASATERLDSDHLVALVASPDESSQRRRRALLTLASRRDLRATPLATPMLRHDDEDARQAALQALTLLGDPRAVPDILAFAERQPPAIRRQCIDAVKATESPLAAAWLFVLSTGHPDAGVQAHARAALALLPASVRGEEPAPAVAQAPVGP